MDTIIDWKNAFYQEQKAREEIAAELEVTEHELNHELELRIDGETDLLTCMQTIKRLGEESELRKREHNALVAAAEPVVDLFEPRVAGVEP